MPKETLVPLSEETKDAVEKCFKLTSKQMLGFAQRLTRSPQDAEDVMSEAYVDLARSLEKKTICSKKDKEQVKYLRGIIRHRAADLYRAHYCNNEVCAGEMILQLWSDRAEMVEFHDTSRREQIEDALEEVCRVIGSMPPIRREVAALHLIGEWTYSEIAEELKISRGAVRNHVWKALRELKKLPTGALALRARASGRDNNDQ